MGLRIAGPLDAALGVDLVVPSQRARFFFLDANDHQQSPADPSSAKDCVVAAIQKHATAADRELGNFLCGCEDEPGCAEDLPHYTISYLMMMTAADVSSMKACLSDNGCGKIESCAAKEPIGPHYSCE